MLSLPTAGSTPDQKKKVPGSQKCIWKTGQGAHTKTGERENNFWIQKLTSLGGLVQRHMMEPERFAYSQNKISTY